jgi:hypothetical protein
MQMTTESLSLRQAAAIALPETHAAMMPPRGVLLMASIGLLLSVCAVLAGIDLGSILGAIG